MYTNHSNGGDLSSGCKTILRSWFHKLRRKQTIDTTTAAFKEILERELDFNLQKCPQHLAHILPSLCAYLIQKWPHWMEVQTRYNETIKKGESRQFIHNLRAYLKLELHRVTSNFNEYYASAMDQLNNETDLNSKHSTSKANGFANFTIQINCPAKMLNTICFSDFNDDVVIRDHAPRQWQPIKVAHLMHWPFVEIAFNTAELKFVRRQAIKYVRYLNLTNHQHTFPDLNIIQELEIFNHQLPRIIFSRRLLKEYIREYQSVLRSKMLVDSLLYAETELLLNHLLEDIHVIDQNNTIATNTRILFRLSPHRYARLKKMQRYDRPKECSETGYCEIHEPHVELLLHQFTASQATYDASMCRPDGSPLITFTYLNRVKRNELDGSFIMPRITYKCTFCNVTFAQNGSQLMINHIRNEHTLEQSLRCSKCKEQFEIAELSANRWDHDCCITDTGKSDKR